MVDKRVRPATIKFII